LGREFAKLGFVNTKKQEKETIHWLEKMGLKISPNSKMKDLSISETQLVEIAKALSYDSKILIMDEPTSAITDNEIAKLFEAIKTLKKEGIGIIYISHKLDELEQVADRVEILRDGNFITVKNINELSKQDIIRHMVNREISEMYPQCENQIGEVVLEVKNLERKENLRIYLFAYEEEKNLG